MTEVIRPVATPIWVAVTMNGSDVACSSPIAMAARRPKARSEQGWQAAHDQQRQQEHRHPEQGGRAVQQPVEVEPDPLADEEHRHQEAVADRLQLDAEVRVRRRVPVDQADDGAGQEGAEDALQTEPLRPGR